MSEKPEKRVDNGDVQQGYVYRTPDEVVSDDPSYRPHVIEIHNAAGERMAFAELLQFEEPFLFYKLHWINATVRGSGYGSQVVKAVNDFLTKRNALGILTDGAPDRIGNFYERHGWVGFGGRRGNLMYIPSQMSSMNPNEAGNAMTDQIHKEYPSTLRI